MSGKRIWAAFATASVLVGVSTAAAGYRSVGPYGRIGAQCELAVQQTFNALFREEHQHDIRSLQPGLPTDATTREDHELRLAPFNLGLAHKHHTLTTTNATQRVPRLCRGSPVLMFILEAQSSIQQPPI